MHRAYAGEQQVQLGPREAADSSEAAGGDSRDHAGESWDLLGPPAVRSNSEAGALHADTSCPSMHLSQRAGSILSLIGHKLASHVLAITSVKLHCGRTKSECALAVDGQHHLLR